MDSLIYGLNLPNLVPRVAMEAASLPNASLSPDDHHDFTLICLPPSTSNITARLQLDCKGNCWIWMRDRGTVSDLVHKCLQ